jgi:lipopolysaccharide export system protein LptA
VSSWRSSIKHFFSVCVALFILVVSAATADERLEFSASRSESVFAEGREWILLQGAARVESESYLIEAEEIQIYGDGQRYVESTGGVTVYDRENDLFLTCAELFLDRELEYLRADGNAYMEDRANEVVVKGGLIQNWEARDLTEIAVNVRILGEDYTARGQFARYRRGADTLELSGTPEVFWKGDEYRATRIRIDIGNDEVELIGDVRATVRQQTDDRNE